MHGMFLGVTQRLLKITVRHVRPSVLSERLSIIENNVCSMDVGTLSGWRSLFSD